MLPRIFKSVWQLTLCAVLSASVLPGASAVQLAREPIVLAARQECVVYITRTGERYHVDGCRYLRQSRIPVSKKDAVKAGYTPCKVCGGSNC
jgi:hypothetical protein